MSIDEPQVGDRVRVVLEGEVLSTSHGWVYFGHNAVHATASDVVSVEKVAPPLPTTPGSLIRDHSGSIWMRQDIGSVYAWRRPDGDECADTYGGFDNGIEVIFDAAQVKP